MRRTRRSRVWSIGCSSWLLCTAKRVVCIIDQHLDGYDAGSFTGMGLVNELRQRGFNGLLVIQSANDELEDERSYAWAPMVHWEGSQGRRHCHPLDARAAVASSLPGLMVGTEGVLTV